MFTRNRDIDLAVNNLYEKVKNAEYGSRYSWKQFLDMTGIKTPFTKNQLYHILGRVSSLMMANDMRVFTTIHGYGKRIINPDEHNITAKKQIKRSVKLYRNAGGILAATNLDLLNEEQKNEVISDANRYRTLELFAVEVLKKKTLPHLEGAENPANLILDMIKLFSNSK